MVAISILTVGLLGILTLLTKSFQLTRVVDDQTTATYLASEGIEVAKNLIDHDVYSGIANPGDIGIGAGWGSCFPYASAHYQIDYQTFNCSLINVSITTDTAPIYFNPTSGLYGDNSALGSPTIFSRDVLVTNVNSSEIDVQSTVSWKNDFGVPDSITLEDQFYNWHQ